MIKLFKKNLLSFIILILFILTVFSSLPQTFYQQDEWFSLGAIYADGSGTILQGIWNPIDFLFIKGRILSSGLGYIFLNYFPLQNTQLAVVSIFLHIIATYLVYYLINKSLKNQIFSLVGAIFFAINGVSHGAVTWPVIALNTVTSTILIQLSTIFFFKFMENLESKWIIFTGLAIYLSLWLKETGTYLLLFLPLSTLIFRKFPPTLFLKTFWVYILAFVSIVVFRIIQYKTLPATVNLYITGENQHFFSTLLLRSILYPLSSFSLMFVPGDFFLGFAREVLREIYPFFANDANNILIAQSAILDLLAVVLTLLIFLVIVFLLKKAKTKERNFIYFWVIFTLMSFLPYILQSKDFSYLEGRYYYLSAVGGAAILAWIIKRIWEVLGQKIFILIILPMLIFYIGFHASVVRHAIAEQVNISTIRKDFISQLKNLVPTLENNKNVFYISGDQNYWAEGNKIPFQQGSGYTLMVLYYQSGKIPKEFLKPQELLKDGFLFDIGSQGYKEKGDFGFGYFWDETELENTIKSHDLPLESIIRLHYNSDTNKLTRVD